MPHSMFLVSYLFVSIFGLLAQCMSDLRIKKGLPISRFTRSKTHRHFQTVRLKIQDSTPEIPFIRIAVCAELRKTVHTNIKVPKDGQVCTF